MSVRSRTISLFCPSLSKLVPFVALEDHGIDIGTISGTFGLDPATLRLNGHLVGRGINNISSVTWKSLLSYFSNRGFSTGQNNEESILVEGKSCGVETEGPQKPIESEILDLQITDDESLGDKRKAWLDDVHMLKKRKMDQCDSAINPDTFRNIPAIRNTQITFSCFNENLKRPREDEMTLITTPSKRSR